MTECPSSCPCIFWKKRPIRRQRPGCTGAQGYPVDFPHPLHWPGPWLKTTPERTSSCHPVQLPRRQNDLIILKLFTSSFTSKDQIQPTYQHYLCTQSLILYSSSKRRRMKIPASRRKFEPSQEDWLKRLSFHLSLNKCTINTLETFSLASSSGFIRQNPKRYNSKTMRDTHRFLQLKDFFTQRIDFSSHLYTLQIPNSLGQTKLDLFPCRTSDAKISNPILTLVDMPPPTN